MNATARVIREQGSGWDWLSEDVGDGDGDGAAERGTVELGSEGGI
jgi:hypothetical protein